MISQNKLMLWTTGFLIAFKIAMAVIKIRPNTLSSAESRAQCGNTIFVVTGMRHESIMFLTETNLMMSHVQVHNTNIFTIFYVMCDHFEMQSSVPMWYSCVILISYMIQKYMFLKTWKYISCLLWSISYKARCYSQMSMRFFS